MPKRALRLHHEKRIKKKFERVIKEILALPDWPWGDRARQEFVNRFAPRMAHHPRHDCEICREGEKEERRRRQFEIKKKAPLED